MAVLIAEGVIHIAVAGVAYKKPFLPPRRGPRKNEVFVGWLCGGRKKFTARRNYASVVGAHIMRPTNSQKSYSLEFKGELSFAPTRTELVKNNGMHIKTRKEGKEQPKEVKP